MDYLHKRCREDTDGSPEAKRVHADLLFNFLSEEDSDADDCNPADQDLATVMKSFEEEIAQSPVKISSEIEARKVEIEYLQGASDDDLGIPPPEAASLAGGGREEDKSEGFGTIWVFEDDGIPAWYEGLMEYVYPTEEDNGGVADCSGCSCSAVLLDGGTLDVMGCF